MKKVSVLFEQFLKSLSISKTTSRINHELVLYRFRSQTKQPIEEALKQLCELLESNYAATTFTRIISTAVKPFVNWLKDNDLLQAEYQLPLKKTFSRRKKTIATVKAIQSLDAIALELSDEDLLVAEVLLETGMRPSELAALKATDIQEKTIKVSKSRVNNVTRNTTKTGKARQITVSAECLIKIKEIIATKRMSGFLERFGKVAKALFGKGFGAYSLRRGAISNAVVRSKTSIGNLALYFGNSVSVLERHYIATGNIAISI
ncbi:MAG: tyrosine-type recombinase/integrase [Xenococcaceae cyanobacterium]